MTIATYLEAARVPATISPQTFGPWTIERRRASDSILGELNLVGWPDYTLLRRMARLNWSNIHLEGPLERVGGEVVMEDSRRELSRHLPIWLAAHGRVLVTGLGLGCVVRGLLASPVVDHIEVVEIDRSILRIIGQEFIGNPRVTLHHGDALKITLDRTWDFAWHDLWTDGDEHLQTLHAALIKRFWKQAKKQGAWQFPRQVARRLPQSVAEHLLGIPRRRAAV